MEIDVDQSPIRCAAPDDWPLVAEITGEAFAEDPVSQWVMGKPASIRSIFQIMARDIYAQRGLCYLAGDGGATMWLPPGEAGDMSTRTQLSLVWHLLRQTNLGALPRALEAGNRMEKHHPKERHMYLFTIGTRQTARGTGLGKALLSPILAACDRDGLPVYLENSNPINTGFYRSFGFESRGTFAVGDNGPIMEPMWRDPKR